MSFKLNAELINTTAVVEAASSQISEVAEQTVSTVAEPIVIPETVINFVNIDQLQNPVLKWFAGDGGEIRNVRTTDTQIKPNAGFKIWLVDDSNITFAFNGDPTNFTITANNSTVDGHQNQIVIQGDQYLILKAKNGNAYITGVTINNRTASINEVLFNGAAKLGGDSGLDVEKLRVSTDFQFSSCCFDSPSGYDSWTAFINAGKIDTTYFKGFTIAAEPKSIDSEIRDHDYADGSIQIGYSWDSKAGAYSSYPTIQLSVIGQDMDYSASYLTIKNSDTTLHTHYHESGNGSEDSYITVNSGSVTLSSSSGIGKDDYYSGELSLSTDSINITLEAQHDDETDNETTKIAFINGARPKISFDGGNTWKHMAFVEDNYSTITLHFVEDEEAGTSAETNTTTYDFVFTSTTGPRVITFAALKDAVASGRAVFTSGTKEYHPASGTYSTQTISSITSMTKASDSADYWGDISVVYSDRSTYTVRIYKDDSSGSSQYLCRITDTRPA